MSTTTGYLRQQGLLEASGSLVPPHPTGARAMVARVYSGSSFPSAGGKYYLTHPVSVLFSEAENASGNLTVDTGRTVPVFVLGHAASAGEDLVAHFVGHRWAAERRQVSGGTNPTVPNCACVPMPATITQTSNGEHPKYLSCTYTWGAFPSFPLPNQNYYSNEQFNDSATGDVFRYILNCGLGFIYLSRWFPNGSVNNVYSTEGTIFQWLVGMPGNTCNPFVMSSGQPQAGVVTAQYVTLSSP